MNQFLLRPGTPDDDNRDYLPEKIKGTDIVVNENGNNSQPYPEKLVECTGILNADGDLVSDPACGISGTWYEYVPDNYDGSRNVPLVFSMHGGLMTGWGQCIYTSWSMLSERDGFICCFPNSHSNRFWQLQVFHDRKEKPKPLAGVPIPEPAPSYEENTDLNFIKALMKHLQKKYTIDPGRIFMQGMSNGCAMTHQFARHYGYMLAGAACSAGPGYLKHFIGEDRKVFNVGGPVAMWEAHPENNRHGEEAMIQESRKVRESRYYWLTVNGCDPMPKISIQGEDNFAFFSGGKAPYVFMDIRTRDHGQTLDEAYLYWDYLFSGIRRLPDGTLEVSATNLDTSGDAFSVAIADGVPRALINQKPEPLSTAPIRWQKLKYHGLNGGTQVMGEYTCVPLTLLAKMSGGVLETSEDTLSAVLTLPDKRRLQFARGSIGCMIDDRLRSMYCEALHRNGELLVSIEWFAEYVLNLRVSKMNGVTYVTDHIAHLSTFMADLIQDILTDQILPADYIERSLLDI